MPVAVYMRDGRTVFLIPKRSLLGRLLARQPDNEEPGVEVRRGIWNPAAGEYVWTDGIYLRYLAKGAIGWVEQATEVGA